MYALKAHNIMYSLVRKIPGFIAVKYALMAVCQLTCYHIVSHNLLTL